MKNFFVLSNEFRREFRFICFVSTQFAVNFFLASILLLVFGESILFFIYFGWIWICFLYFLIWMHYKKQTKVETGKYNWGIVTRRTLDPIRTTLSERLTEYWKKTFVCWLWLRRRQRRCRQRRRRHQRPPLQLYEIVRAYAIACTICIRNGTHTRSIGRLLTRTHRWFCSVCARYRR